MKLNEQIYSIDWSSNIHFLFAFIAYKGVAEGVVHMIRDPKDNVFPITSASQEFEHKFIDHRMKPDNLQIRTDIKDDLMKNDSTVKKVWHQKIVCKFERVTCCIIVDEVEMNKQHGFSQNLCLVRQLRCSADLNKCVENRLLIGVKSP